MEGTIELENHHFVTSNVITEAFDLISGHSRTGHSHGLKFFPHRLFLIIKGEVNGTTARSGSPALTMQSNITHKDPGFVSSDKN